MKSRWYRFFFDENKYNTKDQVIKHFEKHLSDANNIQVALRDEKTRGYGFFMLTDNYNFILLDKNNSHYGYFNTDTEKNVHIEDFIIELNE